MKWVSNRNKLHNGTDSSRIYQNFYCTNMIPITESHESNKEMLRLNETYSEGNLLTYSRTDPLL